MYVVVLLEAPEGLLMSTHNIPFPGEIRKICEYPILSGAMALSVEYLSFGMSCFP